MSAQPEHPYRLSDAERDEAISVLADAYADGRLDAAEFDERMATASAARYAADLDGLFTDLPPRPTPRAAVAVRSQRPATRRRPPPFFLVPLAFLAVLVTFGHLWLLFPVLFLFMATRTPAVARGPGGPARRCGRW